MSAVQRVYCAAAFAVWNYVQRPDVLRLVLCGLAMGAALAAKFTAIFMLPVVGLLLLAAVRWGPKAEKAGDRVSTRGPVPLRERTEVQELPREGKPGKAAAPAAFDHTPYGRAAGAFLLMLGIALVVIEVVYGFHGGVGRYIDGMRLVNGDHDPNYLTYLGGHLRYRFENYFAVAYLLKEPVAALVLAGLGIFLLIGPRRSAYWRSCFWCCRR